MLGLGRIGQDGAGYEYRDPGRSLVVRGTHPEWVLLAAAEVIGHLSRCQSDALVAELAALRDLGAVGPAEISAARIAHRARFDTSPRCSIALGLVDYFWSSPDVPGLKPDAMAVLPLTLGPAMLVAAPTRGSRMSG